MIAYLKIIKTMLSIQEKNPEIYRKFKRYYSKIISKYFPKQLILLLSILLSNKETSKNLNLYTYIKV